MKEDRETTVQPKQLSFNGSLTVADVEKLKDGLRQALTETGHVSIDLSECEEIDFSILQLICAAHQAAVTLNKKMTLASKMSPAVESALSTGGFLRHVGCMRQDDSPCMWLTKEAD